MRDWLLISSVEVYGAEPGYPPDTPPIAVSGVGGYVVWGHLGLSVPCDSPRKDKKVRARLSTVAGIATAITVVLALPALATDGRTVTPPPSADSAADRAADWLATKAAAAGFLAGPTGQADVSATTYGVLAFHAAKRQKLVADRAVTWLRGHAESFIKDSSSNDQPGSLALVILAAHAHGVDPTNFGASHDLVARLLATQHTTGTDAGLFGSQDPTYDGAFRQGLSLAALGAVGQGGGSAASAAKQWLVAQQCADGGWMPYRADLAVACAPNPSLFVDEQTDQAGAALMGLRAIGFDLSTLAHNPRPFLHAQQRSGGGFRYNTSGEADPNSTAYGLHAVIALGDNPQSSPWKVGGKSAFDGLRAFQLTNGALFYPSGGGTPQPNMLATVQAAPALAGYTLPVPHTVIPSAPKPVVKPTPAPKPATSGRSTPTTEVLGQTETLPDTGGNVPTWLVLTGELLVAGGALLVGGSRRTRRRSIG
ncbi:MAG: hypothetical protein QOG53_3375 [Frankiales bacterium]|nr:hypothetical protein [Frankiales bacterium]